MDAENIVNEITAPENFEIPETMPFSIQESDDKEGVEIVGGHYSLQDCNANPFDGDKNESKDSRA